MMLLMLCFDADYYALRQPYLPRRCMMLTFDCCYRCFDMLASYVRRHLRYMLLLFAHVMISPLLLDMPTRVYAALYAPRHTFRCFTPLICRHAFAAIFHTRHSAP